LIDVTGVPTRIEKGSTFELTSRGPLGQATTTFKVEEFDALREIKLRCQTSGFYSHWLLTEARSNTSPTSSWASSHPPCALRHFGPPTTSATFAGWPRTPWTVSVELWRPR
jgi:hypothetical protein